MLHKLLFYAAENISICCLNNFDMFFKQFKLKLFYTAIVLLFHETTPVLICCSYYSDMIFIKLSWLAARSHYKSA